MICQIRGRFSGASGSPLPAPVVTRHGEAWWNTDRQPVRADDKPRRRADRASSALGPPPSAFFSGALVVLFGRLF